MTKKIIQIAKGIAEETAERQELEIYLDILDNAGGILEDFISETCNFYVDTKPTKNGHSKKIDDKDKDGCLLRYTVETNIHLYLLKTQLQGNWQFFLDQLQFP